MAAIFLIYSSMEFDPNTHNQHTNSTGIMLLKYLNYVLIFAYLYHTVYTPRPVMSAMPVLGSRAKEIIYNVSENLRRRRQRSLFLPALLRRLVLAGQLL